MRSNCWPGGRWRIDRRDTDALFASLMVDHYDPLYSTAIRRNYTRLDQSPQIAITTVLTGANLVATGRAARAIRSCVNDPCHRRFSTADHLPLPLGSIVKMLRVDCREMALEPRSDKVLSKSGATTQQCRRVPQRTPRRRTAGFHRHRPRPRSARCRRGERAGLHSGMVVGAGARSTLHTAVDVAAEYAVAMLFHPPLPSV